MFDFKKLETVVKRPIVYYLACILIVAPIVNWPLFLKNSKDQTMNRLAPAINYFKDFDSNLDSYSKFKLNQCVYYHQKVVEYYPFEEPAADVMIGFCSALLGNTKQAIKAFNDSADLNPNNFWPLYDLGIIYYQKKDYPKAIHYFQEALLKNVKFNVFVLYDSKVYADIRLSDRSREGYDFLEVLMKGRKTAYIYIMESFMRLGDFDKVFEIAVFAMKEKLGDLDIFYSYAGRAAFNQKAYERAIDLLETAIKLNPNNPEALTYLGMCMSIAGKKDLEQKFFKAAQEVYETKGSVIETSLHSKVKFF